MKTKRLLVVSLALLSMLTTIGVCNLGSRNSADINVIYAENNDASCSSVKEAITKLANSKNYTINVSTKTGPLDITNKMFYTENAYYDDYLGDEYGYVKEENGVYKFDRYARKFTASAYLEKEDGSKYNEIWGQGFFYGFKDLDVSEFAKANGKEFDCTKKVNKMTFMKMFSIDLSKYPDVNSIKITVDDSINGLAFSVSLKGGEEHKCVVSDFGETKIDYLDKNIAAGKGVYTPDATMTKIIDLFKGLNYTHLMYDTQFNETNPVGYEKFTEDYFISGYTDEYLKENIDAVIKCSGMVGYDHYKVNDDVTLNGAYWTYLYGDSFSMVTSFPYNEDPYVPNVYTYPTFLSALKNSQYFESAGAEGTYYTSKISIVSDFCTNFQLWESLEAQSFIPCGLFVEYANKGGKDYVTFKIEYDYFGLLGTTDFEFTDFGTTREDRLDKKYVNKYVNAYFNGSKTYVTCEGFDESKKLSVHTKSTWLLDDNIEEAYEYIYFKNAPQGSKLEFKVKDGDNLVTINATPLDSEDNNNYVVTNGNYCIKETANTSIYLFKYKDGSWKFKAVKAN